MQWCYPPRRCCLSSLDTTKNVLRVVFLCLHVFSLSSSATEIAVIGVLCKQALPTKCEQIMPREVYEIESLKYLANLLNTNKYIQNVKLEIDVVAVCQNKSSVTQTIKLINKYKTGPKKLIGILSMTTSEDMLNVSWFLSSLPPEDTIVQIGTVETAYQLNNRSSYRTFFRVIPDDDYQFELISKLLKQLEWNYIAILHEKDVYGEEGAKLLSKRLPALGITLAAKLPIDTINEQLFTLSSDYPKVQGVVIIAQPWTFKSATKRRTEHYQFIFTESVLVDDSFVNLELFNNSAAVFRPHIAFPDLERHWESLFNVGHIKQNEIFRQMTQQSSECPSVLDSSCNLTSIATKLSKQIHKASTLSKFFGLYTFAFLMRKKSAHCGNKPCPLSILKLDDIQNQIIDFSYLGEILKHPMNLTGQFNEKGNLFFPNGFAAYRIYNNIKNDTTGRYSFQEVGQYNGKEVVLNNSAVSNLKRGGVCPLSRNCHTCSRGDFPKFIYKEGDIMLFGIFPVRSGTNAITCPCYTGLASSNLLGSNLAEAMVYAVEQLNQRTTYKNLFPGKKVGYVIMDSCNQQIPTFKNLVSFRRGEADICKKGLNCEEITKKTLVYIGALASEVSIRVSRLMTAWNTVQISYASTSSIFRGPMSYEYSNFIRPLPSDHLQIAAMIDICVKMKWFYVSVIYADNSYGRPAKRELLSKAKYSKICVTQSLPFKEGTEPSSILGELKKRPDAKVVIVFLNSASVGSFMTSMTATMEEREFTFLGSEAWGTSVSTVKIGEKIAGSLSLKIDMPLSPGFQNYLEHKQLSLTQSNEWSLAAMENKCYMPLSLNKKGPVQCSANMTLSALGEHLWSPMVIQTVYAAALGLNMTIAQLCDTVEVCPKLFEKSKEVIEIFKKVKMKGPNGKEKRVFDDTGDGTLPYAIYEIQKQGKKFVYSKIGSWSETSGLKLEAKQIYVPSLDCPNQKRCSECPVVGYVQPHSEEYIPALVAFFILLLLLLVAIFILWRFTRTRSQENTQRINDLDEPGDSNNVTESETHSNEDNRYAYIRDWDVASPPDSDTEETQPKQRYVPDEDPYIHPRVIESSSVTTDNPAYEDDECC